MSLSYKIAITTTVAYSAMSLYDAAYHGVTGRTSVFSDAYGMTWATITGAVLGITAYTALAVVLVTARGRIDGGSTVRRRIRQLLVVDFGALAAVYAVDVFLPDPDSLIGSILGIVAGLTFAAMFLLAFALGLSLLRVPELRISAVLLVAVVPIIGLTVAVQALAPSFAHPAYAETAVYLGVALLARKASPVGDLDAQETLAQSAR